MPLRVRARVSRAMPEKLQLSRDQQAAPNATLDNILSAVHAMYARVDFLATRLIISTALPVPPARTAHPVQHSPRYAKRDLFLVLKIAPRARRAQWDILPTWREPPSARAVRQASMATALGTQHSLLRAPTALPDFTTGIRGGSLAQAAPPGFTFSRLYKPPKQVI